MGIARLAPRFECRPRRIIMVGNTRRCPPERDRFPCSDHCLKSCWRGVDARIGAVAVAAVRIAEEQRAIAANWIAAYRHYVNPGVRRRVPGLSLSRASGDPEREQPHQTRRRHRCGQQIDFEPAHGSMPRHRLRSSGIILPVVPSPRRRRLRRTRQPEPTRRSPASPKCRLRSAPARTSDPALGVYGARAGRRSSTPR